MPDIHLVNVFKEGDARGKQVLEGLSLFCEFINLNKIPPNVCVSLCCLMLTNIYLENFPDEFDNLLKSMKQAYEDTKKALET